MHGDLTADADGLSNLKQSIDPNNILKWSGNNVCQWHGVACGIVGSQTTERVTELRLPKLGLAGSIPPNSLSQVTEIRVISLRSNKLSGLLPTDLVNCSFLRSIYLQDNSLSGPLPTNFSAWPNLYYAVFSFNQFTGVMPASLATLQNIKSLNLENNSLTGPVPTLNMSSLQNFNISYNGFTGSIPNTVTYGKFDSSAFLGNSLCGFPLAPCVAPPAPATAPGPPVAPPANRRTLSPWAIVGIVIGAVVLLLLLCLLCFCARKKTKSSGTKQANPYEASASDDNVSRERGPDSEAFLVAGSAAASSSEQPDRKLVFFEGNKYTFTLEDLLRASAEVLGKGTVGSSYKAILESGMIVAVKRLKDSSIQKREFEERMESYGKLKHENLVPLIAYYYSREEKLSVADFMANGSLSAILHGSKDAYRTPLDWGTRLGIAIGAARGINHLHGENITHGNIKSSNILLTSNYTGCVSDFGLTQLVNPSSTASRMSGYRAPEVTDIRNTTQQSDVYSFGILLLEILTGKSPSQASMSEEELALPDWAQSVSRDEEDWRSKMFDPQLTQGSEDEMEHVLDIALACINSSSGQRPTMNEVVGMLEAESK